MKSFDGRQWAVITEAILGVVVEFEREPAAEMRRLGLIAQIQPESLDKWVAVLVGRTMQETVAGGRLLPRGPSFDDYETPARIFAAFLAEHGITKNKIKRWEYLMALRAYALHTRCLSEGRRISYARHFMRHYAL